MAAILKAVPGGVSKVQRIKNGKLNDGKDGQPAEQWYDDKGTLIRIVHYLNGLRNDGADGDAAVQWRDKGVIGVVHCIDGKRHDGPKGEPAVQRYNLKGKLVYAVSCANEDGHPVKKLTPREMAGCKQPPTSMMKL